MIRNLTLITSLLTLSIADASAQRRQAFPSIPVHTISAVTSAEALQQKLQRIRHAAHGSSGAMLKTTSGGERLIAQAAYDFSNVPAGELVDTISLKYSGNRTSAFDFDYLQYDFGNEADAPGIFNGTGYVHFDTGRAYDQAGPVGYAFRTYNANGKIVRTDFEDAIELFTYDAPGRLVKKVTVERNSTSGTYIDSSYRNFYAYNTAGHVLMDSAEQWITTTSSWKPDMTVKYTPDAAGNTVQALFTTYFSPTPLVFMQYNFVYNAANMPVLIATKYDDGNGNLVDAYKDSLGYTASMRVWSRSYEWNTGSSAWDLTYEEKRHLNTASLPDSILTREIFGGGSIDTSIQKLTYNAQGNPVYLRGFTAGSTTPDYELRWYYQTHGGVGVKGITAENDLSVYPNPASDMLYVKGGAEGRYSIQNMAGQVLQSGTLHAAAGLPVGTLAAGVYSLSLQDKNGVVRTTQFIRQ